MGTTLRVRDRRARAAQHEAALTYANAAHAESLEALTQRGAALSYAEHRITWYVWAGTEKLRHTATMRGRWGWDAECSCGWASRTGGGVRRWVNELVWQHKFRSSHGIPDD